MAPLYAPFDTIKSGHLKVSPIHSIYWEECGSSTGIPIVYFHGGPGGGISDEDRRYFDPQHYRIILFDQRGAGRSTPHACLEDNTTWTLIEDAQAIRSFLKIDRWIVFGGSWGSTLSLTYAEHASAWSKWEAATSHLLVNPKYLQKAEDSKWALAFARIESHFFVNQGWMEDGKLIEDAHKIKHLPIIIIQGRYDVVCPAKTSWDLYKALGGPDNKNVEYRIVDDCGHSAHESGTQLALVDAADKFKSIKHPIPPTD
ncbi:hypothetical protein EPUL_002465, partial [Erysiphe pulchra]